MAVRLDAYPKTHPEYLRARDELLDASLVFRNAEEEDLRILPSVQDVVRQGLSQEEQEATFEAVVQLTSAVWPFGTNKNKNTVARWPVLDMWLAHVSRLVELFGDRINSGTFEASDDSAALFSDASWYMIERGIPDRTLAFATVAQQIVLHREMTPDERGKYILQGTYMAQAISAQGSLDGSSALEGCKKALALVIDRHLRFPLLVQADELAVCYNNLGLAYVMVPDIRRSIESWEASIKAFQSQANAGPLDWTWPGVSLCFVLSQNDQANKAIDIVDPIVEAVDRDRGVDDRTTCESGAIWRAKGTALVALGRFDEGLQFHQRAYRNLIATLGGSHYQTADCAYNVAQGLFRQDEVEEASAMLDVAIKAYGFPTCRAYQASLGKTLWRKAASLRRRGMLLDSEGYFSKAMHLRASLVPDEKSSADVLDEKDWEKLQFYYSR